MDKPKVALVTGASRGIGKAIAIELSRDGYMVLGTATSEQNAKSIDEYFSNENLSGKGLVLDLSNKDNINNLVDNVLNEFSCIDVLINNAAITKDNLLLRMKEEDWNEVLKVNLDSVFILTKNLIKPMIKKRWGRIVNISSVVAYMGNPGQVNYCAAKAGILGFTKSLSIELANRNITVNSIAPGFIETDMTNVLTEEQKSSILASVPMNKLGNSQDIAHAVSFLCSKRAGYITGQTLHVNGGMYTS